MNVAEGIPQDERTQRFLSGPEGTSREIEAIVREPREELTGNANVRKRDYEILRRAEDRANSLLAGVVLPGGGKPAKVGFSYQLSRIGTETSDFRSEVYRAMRWAVRLGLARSRDRAILRRRDLGLLRSYVLPRSSARNRSKGCAGTRSRGSRRVTARSSGPPGDGDSSDGEPASRFRPELDKLAVGSGCRG